MINLNEMVVFERVVREGGFTAAARALKLSKSSVSEQVSRLEERLGARLLHRTTRRIRLTDAGQDYYQRCVRIVSEAREADLSVTESRITPQGVLRLTAPHLFGDAFLTPIISAYLQRYPDTSIDVMLAERRVDLIAEGFDLAIRLGGLDDSQLIAKKLGQARSVYCASPAYLARHGEPETPRELAEHRCIVVGHSIEVKWPFFGQGSPMLIPVVGRLAVNSLVMGRDAALRGGGVAFLPMFMCDAEVARGDLQLVLAPWSPPAIPIYAMYASNRYLSAKVRAFLDLLVDRTSAAPPWAGPHIASLLAQCQGDGVASLSGRAGLVVER